jgi:acetyltransferase-like isoleucine patch superfamily enzyme
MIDHIQLIIEDLLRPISGSLGKYLRRIYYRRRLGKCGRGLDIATGVRFVNPNFIELGDHISIDYNCILVAGRLNKKGRVTYLNLSQHKDLEGRIIIGSYSHVGIANIIQGHGGVQLGDYFTSSSNCTIYSLSNDPGRCRKGTLETDESASYVYYVSGNVITGTNVWIGLNVNLLSCTLGNDVFVRPGTTVTGSFSDNTIVSGSPVVSTGMRFK